MLNLDSIDALDTALVSLTEAKDQCFVTGSDDDTLLTTLITVAREYAEARTWKQIIPATYTLYLDDFPTGIIELPKPPVIAVASVKYYDSDDTLQTVSSSDYQVDLKSKPARIKPEDSWHSADDRLNAVEIVFTAGYDDSDEEHKLPKKIKQAMLIMIKHWFENRSAVVINEGRSVDVKEVPLSADVLLGMESAREFV